MHWPQFISAKEFENPDKLNPLVIENAAYTREWLASPIYLTQSVKGVPRHPHGDAVHPNGTSHSRYSLHKWGIDHNASKRRGFLVRDNTELGKAIDVDFGADSIMELWEQYLEIVKLGLWSGIGIYPDWRNKGFHFDIRDRDHPNYSQHWYMHGGYYKKLTWKNFKRDLGRHL